MSTDRRGRGVATTGGVPRRMALALLAGMAALVAGLTVADPPARGAFPGDNGRIAYARATSASNTGIDIWTVRADGSDPRAVVAGGLYEQSPNWSPDGSRIAYEAAPPPFTPQAASTTPIPAASSSSGASSPGAVPGGAEVAGAGTMSEAPPGSQAGLYVVNGDGSGVPTMVAEGALNTEPTWSPDGQSLAFVVQYANQQRDIYRVVVARPDEVQRVTTTGGYKRRPAWSPDGALIAFTQEQSDESFGLYTVPSTGGTPQRINLPVRVIDPDAVSWSPDGRRIAFQARTPIPPNSENNCQFELCRDVYVLDLAAGQMTNITGRDGYDHLDPAFSPDGAFLAVSSNRDFDPSCDNCYDIHVHQLAGGTSVNISRDTSTPPDNSTVPAVNEGQPDWQPVIPSIRIDPPTLDFGTQRVGTSGAVRSVTVTSGGPGTLRISQVAVDGPQGAEFVKAADTCTGVPLPSGARCRIDLRFAPTGAGPRAGSLAVTSNVPGGPQRVGLVGLGEGTPPVGGPPPAIRVDPLTIDFGPLTVATTSEPRTFAVSNVGQGTLQVGALALAGSHPGDFVVVVDGCSGVALVANQRCEVGVRFAPVQLDRRTASITVPSNAPGAAPRVELTGVGTAGRATPVLALEPSLGPTGFVAAAVGSGFPPNADVALEWRGGIGTFRARADGAGRLRLPVLVFRRDRIGPRFLVARDAGGDAFDPVSAGFLVVPSSFQPDSSGSSRLVIRR